MKDAKLSSGRVGTQVVVLEDTPPLIYEADAYTTYIGYAPPGTNVDTAAWRIVRVVTNCTVPNDYPTTAITNDGTGKSTITEAPNGEFGNHGYKWTLRESLTYIR